MTVPEFAQVKVALDGHVATLRLDTGHGNYLSVASLTELADACTWADAEPAVRAMVLGSAGSVFCAGVDFRALAGSGQDRSPAPLYAQAQRLITLRKPLIAAVQGSAIGAGFGLAMLADLRIAGPKAKFTANFAKLGFHAGFGLTATLPWVMGAHAANRLLLTGDSLAVEAAHALGLVDAVVATDDPVTEAQQRARQLAANAPRAVQDMRATLRAPLIDAYRTAIERELAMQLEHMQSTDFIEGITAAISRRAPAFTGA